MSQSFGQVIPVTGPNIGFVGSVSRLGERVITAREFVQQSGSGTYNLNFGDPAVLIPNTSGGYWDSVLDFVTAATSNIGLLATQWAGIAIREVQTQLTYPAGQTPGIQQVGYYAPSTMAEVLERGSITVALAVGAPNAGAQVYTRVVVNSAVTAGTIGDFETNPAATDLFTLNGITAAAAAATSLTGITFTGVYIGQLVSGAGIAPGTYVVSGTGTAGAYTTIVLSQGLPTAITATSVLTFSNLFALPSVVARTGYVDANNILEVTIKTRNAA
jgi:hypothetical protein